MTKRVMILCVSVETLCVSVARYFYFAVVDIVKDQLEASKPEPVVEEIVSID